MVKKPKSIGEIQIWSPRCRERFLPLRITVGRLLRDHHLMEAGICDLYPGYRLRRKDPVFHLLIFTSGGRGKLLTPFHTQSLVPGQMMIAPAHVPFGYQPDGRRWQFLWYHLADDDEWRDLRNSEVTVRPTLLTPWLQRVTEGYLRESVRKARSSQRAAWLYGELITVYLDQELKTQANPVARNLEDRFYELWGKVNAELKRNWSVAQLAAETHMSVAHFHRMCLKYSGVKPMQMVTRLRMQRAQELLTMHPYPVRVIAEIVGYQNEFAFSTAFKRFAGVSPREFRKQR